MKGLLVVFAVASMGFGVVVAKDLNADHSHGLSSDVVDHSGRTNSEGCHNDRKRGTYHCH